MAVARKPAAAGLLVAAVVAGGFLLTRGGDDALDGVGGEQAPAFSLPDLRGGTTPITLADHAGRPVVVNFFAAWCLPCRNELPALAEVARRTGDRVTFLGVDHVDSRAAAVEMLDEAGVTYPAGYDPKGTVAQAYGLRGLPATVFVTAEGRVLEVARGELDLAGIEGKVQRLLAAEPALRTGDA